MCYQLITYINSRLAGSQFGLIDKALLFLYAFADRKIVPRKAFHWIYPIGNKSELVHIISWNCQTMSHYPNQFWQRSMMLHGITNPQRTNLDWKQIHLSCWLGVYVLLISVLIPPAYIPVLGSIWHPIEQHQDQALWNIIFLVQNTLNWLMWYSFVVSIQEN